MTCRTAGRQLEPEDPLLRAAHAVPPPSVERERFTAALVEQHVAASRVGMGLREPARAAVAPALLVGDEHELQAAMPWSPSLPGERGGSHRFSGDLGLHV